MKTMFPCCALCLLPIAAAAQPANEPVAASQPAADSQPAPAPEPAPAIIAPASQPAAAAAGEPDREALKAELKAELREEMKLEVRRAAQEAALGKKAESVWKEESWIDEIKPELNFLEFDGYLRTRMDLFQRLHLGTYDATAPNDPNDPTAGTRVRATSAVPPPTLFRRNAENTDTLTSANMRLRMQPTLNISEDIAIHATVDLMDNLVLGSTPDALGGNLSQDWSVTSQSAGFPQAGYNFVRDSIAFKRAWAEVMTPFGQLQFGRVPNHFGLGILNNDGNKLDSDYGDSADRVAFAMRLYGHYIVPAWEFTATGPAGRYGADGGASNNELGQLIDLDPRDDVRTWLITVFKKDKPADIDEKLANGDFVINYGGFFSYRMQSYDEPVWYNTPGPTAVALPSDQPADYVVRNANIFTLSLWGMFQWNKLKVEAEAVGRYGSIGNSVLAGGIGAKDPYRDPITMLQWGFALESSYKFLHDSLVVGLDGGMASGDDAPGFGIRPSSNANPQGGDLDGRQYGGCLEYKTDGSGACAKYDVSVENYRFNPDYHIDLILFREVLGTVSDAIYVKPNLTYFITEGLGLRGAVIQSFAHYASSTPGNSNLLGTEANAFLFYQSEDGFYAGVAYGFLYPWAGMSHRKEVDLSSEALREAKFAQTIQGIFGVVY